MNNALARTRSATTMTRFHSSTFSSISAVENRGTISAETELSPFHPGFCLSRKNATLDKFRNKRKVGCTLLHKDARLLERGGRRKREREREEERKGGGVPRRWPRPYRERVEPRKNHKSSDLPVTLRTRRLLERRSTKMMKRIALFYISQDHQRRKKEITSSRATVIRL